MCQSESADSPEQLQEYNHSVNLAKLAEQLAKECLSVSLPLSLSLSLSVRVSACPCVLVVPLLDCMQDPRYIKCACWVEEAMPTGALLVRSQVQGRAQMLRK